MKKLILLLLIYFISYTITQAQCTASVSYSDVSCYDYCDGVAMATGLNGTPPYVFYWSNSMTGTTISNLCPGTYYVTMTDGAGCIDYDTVTITQPPPLQINQTITNPSCSSCTDGFASLAVTGGSGNYSYVWCTGANTPFTNIGVGCCGFAVTDNSSGCVQMDSVCTSFTVGENELNYNENIQLFPNPANDYVIYKTWLNEGETVTIVIYDVMGKPIISKQITGTTEEQFDLSKIYSGIYFYKITLNQKQVQAGKLIINK